MDKSSLVRCAAATVVGATFMALAGRLVKSGEGGGVRDCAGRF